MAPKYARRLLVAFVNGNQYFAILQMQVRLALLHIQKMTSFAPRSFRQGNAALMIKLLPKRKCALCEIRLHIKG